MSSSSFIRKPTSIVTSTEIRATPKGCKLAANDIVTTSSGIPSFERLFGIDGLPLGTMTAILEDAPRSASNYASSMLKCFISEGIYCGQQVLFFDCLNTGQSDTFCQALPPAPRAEQSPSSLASDKGGQEDAMSIAWRYKSMKLIDEDAFTREGDRVYDLSKRMDPKTIPSARLKTFNINEFSLDNIKPQLEKSIKKAKEESSVLRVAIRCFGAPIKKESDYAQMLLCLRQQMCQYKDNLIITLTIPGYALPEMTVNGWMSICDFAIELQSFVGTPYETDRAMADYNGFLVLRRPLRVPGQLSLALPTTNSLAFKLKRKHLLFEPFHLPPDLSDPTESSNPSKSIPQPGGAMGCTSASGSNKLDF